MQERLIKIEQEAARRDTNALPCEGAGRHQDKISRPERGDSGDHEASSVLSRRIPARKQANSRMISRDKLTFRSMKR